MNKKSPGANMFSVLEPWVAIPYPQFCGFLIPYKRVYGNVPGTVVGLNGWDPLKGNYKMYEIPCIQIYEVDKIKGNQPHWVKL